jgi:light-regulated signal transduction histidine kinase (bacteriophytochrome)
MMPNLDGLGLVRALRENPETRTLPVILLSARVGQEASLEGLSAGADDYLAKPFTSQELLARVRTHLTLARTRDELIGQLTQANEDLREFNSSVSHDLQAPLRALDEFAGILEEAHGPELGHEGRRKIGIIRDTVRRAGQIVDALLALSRIGYQSVQRTRFDTKTLVEQVCANLTATNGGANAEVSIGSLPETWGDHSLLRQVWVNLISNAIKYSGKRPRPRVQVYGFDAGEESVFCVKDNGVGFDMSEIGRLFRIFERLHHDEHFAGTGVGLAIVKRIVGKHLGRVWAESVRGEGAAFFFSLPREKDASIDP